MTKISKRMKAFSDVSIEWLKSAKSRPHSTGVATETVKKQLFAAILRTAANNKFPLFPLIDNKSNTTCHLLNRGTDCGTG